MTALPRAWAVAFSLLLLAGGVASAQGPEVVAEVRIHGNYRTPDADVVALAGVAIGQPIDAGGVEAIAKKLRKTGRFESVEVRKRLRSLEATDQVSLIIIVQEFPSTAKGGGIPSPLGRLRDSMMAIPTLEYADGFGLTYGGRISFVQLLGKRGLIGVPLTLGATRQAAVDVDATMGSGPIRRVRGGLSLTSRENPGFEVRDFRKTAWAEGMTPTWNLFSVGVRASWSDVSFGVVHDRLTRYGTGLIFDTRSNPSFPRNAVYATAWWNRLNPDSGPSVNRYRMEAQGYVGFAGSTVLVVRAVSDRADQVLPVYEKPLLGGIDTLRGFRAGSFVGDNLAAGSVELRIPWNSAMHLGQTGFSVFADAGKVCDHGVRMADAKSHSGMGVGWYVRAPLVQINFDVAHGRNAGTRAHVVVGLKF